MRARRRVYRLSPQEREMTRQALAQPSVAEIRDNQEEIRRSVVAGYYEAHQVQQAMRSVEKTGRPAIRLLPAKGVAA